MWLFIFIFLVFGSHQDIGWPFVGLGRLVVAGGDKSVDRRTASRCIGDRKPQSHVSVLGTFFVFGLDYVKSKEGESCGNPLPAP